jgi:nickel-dependent lactate racemase
MFGSIPNEIIYSHDWRHGCKTIGQIPADYVKKISHGKADWPIPVSVNSVVVDGGYDLIINIGHVVPHEVLGFANHNKNYFIGLGGKSMICASHMMAACCGIENNLGNLITPLRACFNKAEREYLVGIPHIYIQIVMTRNAEGHLVTRGIYVGDDLETYLMAARKSRAENITIFDKPIKKVVAVMQADEFKSTWVANKAIYRTRMAVADGGELLIIAPGLERFGEQPEVDRIIRTYGYAGTPEVMRHYLNQPELQDVTHATAHLIHGSSEGRFKISYAPGHLTERDIRQVKFNYVDLGDALRRYQPDALKEGWNTVPDGEEIYFIKTPSAGLWACRDKFENREFDNIGVND